MPVKTLSFLLLLSIAHLLSGYARPSQEQPASQQANAELQQLMNRRADLLQQCRRFNREGNALRGGHSKKDLRKLVETQQKIIQLDHQILNLGKLECYARQTPEKQENLQLHRALYSRIDTLEKALARQQEQLAAAEKRELTARTAIGRQQARNRGLAIALVLVTGILLVSLFYNPVRKKRKS